MLETITLKEGTIPSIEEITRLYSLVDWAHKNFPEMLLLAYENSDIVISAYDDHGKLIGLGRAITDKAFTVYFPDLLVDPEWQGIGVGTAILKTMLEKFSGCHNQVLIAEDESVRSFYSKFGFRQENGAMSILLPIIKNQQFPL